MSAARCTKAQLAEQLEASHVAYQQLRTQYESLQAELHQMRKLHLEALNASPAYTEPLPAPRAPVATSTWREAAAKARDLAIKTGRSVRVG